MVAGGWVAVCHAMLNLLFLDWKFARKECLKIHWTEDPEGKKEVREFRELEYYTECSLSL